MVQSYKIFTSRELSLIIILSALGGASSVPIGHLGNFLKMLPGVPFGASQALSGLHVLWIVLAKLLVRKKWSGIMTGVLKGLVETFLFSFHGVFVLIISSIAGIIVDMIFTVINRVNNTSIYLASGLSSASNVVVIQFILFPGLHWTVYAFMYLLSFISGLVLAGYLCKRIFVIISNIPLK